MGWSWGFCRFQKDPEDNDGSCIWAFAAFHNNSVSGTKIRHENFKKTNRFDQKAWHDCGLGDCLSNWVFRIVYLFTMEENCKSLSFGICLNKKKKNKKLLSPKQKSFLSLIIDRGIWGGFKFGRLECLWSNLQKHLRPLCRRNLWLLKEANDKRPLNRHAKQSHMSLPI